VRVFVCEYVTGGGLAAEPLPPGLLQEGELMLRSLVADLATSGGLDLLVSRDARLPSPELPGRQVLVGEADDCWQVWAASIAEADAVWPVAPETGGVLERLSEIVVASGKLLLGSRPEAVRLCGSKLGTAARLGEHGIPVVPTRWLTEGAALTMPGTAGWVVKPDDGAGAEDTVLIEHRDALAAFAVAERDRRNWVVQPFVPGEVASLCLLCRDGEAALLACNSQAAVIEAGRFHYAGWTVGGSEARRERYEPLAHAVARAIPGLWGYVGIDLIDTPEDGPVVLEINPRLTTTYAGLCDAIGVNPASLVLALPSGAPLQGRRAVQPREIRLQRFKR
jgi:predicted ATP-grasp superfamily ATP-dependent carboligase